MSSCGWLGAETSMILVYPFLLFLYYLSEHFSRASLKSAKKRTKAASKNQFSF